MSQTALITLLTILLYTGGIFGGGQAEKSTDRVPPPAATQSEHHGVVRANTIAVHDAPGSREIKATLVRGDEVTILAETSGWYNVRLANGQTGFVNSFAVTAASTSNPPDTNGRYDVVAYYAAGSSLPSLRENIDIITTVVPWMWQVTPVGALQTDFNTRDVGNALTLAGKNEIKGLALVHNLQETHTGAITFDASLIHEVLSNPDARRRSIDAIYDQLRAWNMSGVHIDFEMVLPKDRQNLNLFMKTLYERLHPTGFEVSIAVPAKTQESYMNTWSGGFDYGAISRHSDKMMLMTYDEHWLGGEPGPVASIGWVERVVRYAISAGVPAEKIILGVPAYGYDWPSRGRGRAVTYSQAMAIASRHGARLRWDATAKVPYFHYAADRQVWFENRSSMSHKLEIVKKYDLGGVSLWRLGQEDPGIWPVIRSQLR